MARDHEVMVLVPRAMSLKSLTRRTSPEGICNEADEVIPKVCSYAYNWLPGSTRCAMRAYVRAATAGLKRIEKTWGRPDLIHAHVVMPAGWSAAKLGQRFGIPVVLTEHTSPFSNHLRTRMDQIRVRRTLEACAGVVALSRSLAADMKDFAGDQQIEVIGEIVEEPGAEDRNPDADQAESPIKIAFVGGLRRQKGVTYLLQAVARLVKGGLDLEVVLAGAGPLEKDLERTADSLEIGERCRFSGLLSRSEVFHLLSSSDLLVVSSIHETFCLAAAEAIACGKPVVVTRCGGPEHFVSPENGIVVKVGDSEALARGIQTVIQRFDSYDSEVMKENITSAYGPAAFLEKINRVYRKAVSSTE